MFFRYPDSEVRLCVHCRDCMINNNNEILNKLKLLLYTRALHAVQKKKKRRKRLGQYNSSDKPIHGQYTSRYN